MADSYYLEIQTRGEAVGWHYDSDDKNFPDTIRLSQRGDWPANVDPAGREARDEAACIMAAEYWNRWVAKHGTPAEKGSDTTAMLYAREAGAPAMRLIRQMFPREAVE